MKPSFRAGIHASKPVLIAAALVLLGLGCAQQTPTYQSTQQPWSELTAEQRAQIRALVRTFDDLEAKTPDEIRAIQPLVIDVMPRGDGAFLPFPERQFTLVTPAQCPDDCPEDHYVGPGGLTLDLRVLDEPPMSCEWGMQSAVTPQEVDQEAFIRWRAEYGKSRNE